MPSRRRRIGRRTRTINAMTFTLGWELEANVRAGRVPSGIESGRDGSVSGDGMEYKTQFEIVSNPTLALNALKELVQDRNLRVDRSCGFHVHIGLGTRSNMAATWASWMVTLARMIEGDAFDAVPESRRNNSYCRRFNSGLYSQNRSVQNVTYHQSKYSNDSRYYWVNVVEMFRSGGIGTVEIRLLGNTRRFTYLLGWTSACQIMARSAWRLTFDPSALNEETDKCKAAFLKIKTGILPNTDAATCIRTANELSVTAGFTVRADGVTPEPRREETARPRTANDNSREQQATPPTHPIERTITAGLLDDVRQTIIRQYPQVNQQQLTDAFLACLTQTVMVQTGQLWHRDGRGLVYRDQLSSIYRTWYANRNAETIRQEEIHREETARQNQTNQNEETRGLSCVG